MTDINQLVQLNVELEGLLKVLIDRKSIHAKSLLADKFRQYSTLIQQFLAEDDQEQSPSSEEKEQIVEQAEDVAAEGQEIEVKDQEAEDAEVEDQDDLAEAAIERGERQAEVASVHQPNPNVLKAFTLNDKFRFIRELFNGDDRDYTETLNLISEMGSYEEAEDYLVNDLLWNPESDVVKDFLNTLQAAYK